MADQQSKAFKKLIEIGFKKDLSGEYLAHSNDSLFTHPKDYQNRDWYFLEGNCYLKSEDLLHSDLLGLHLFIKGDFEVEGYLSNKYVNGLVVLGDVKADNILLNGGPIEFARKTSFGDVLAIHSSRNKLGEIEINQPIGRLYYSENENASFNNLYRKEERSRRDIELFCHKESDWYWGCFEATMPPEFIDFKKTIKIETDAIEREMFNVEKMKIHLPKGPKLVQAIIKKRTHLLFDPPEIVNQRLANIKERILEEKPKPIKYHDKTDEIKNKLSDLKVTVDNLVIQLESEAEWDDGSLKELRNLQFDSPRPIERKQSLEILSQKKLTVPSIYLECLEKVGSLKIGIDELVLWTPNQLGVSLGQLISEYLGDDVDRLGNFHCGHYHDFLVVANYGIFPTEVYDYSDGIAFNKNNNRELILYSCDGFWLSEFDSKRESLTDNMFLEYFVDRITRISERLEEFDE